MNILNDRVSTDRQYPEEHPATLLRMFLQRIVSGFYRNDAKTLAYVELADSVLFKELCGFLPALAEFNPALHIASETGRQAFWINLYNLLVVHLVTDLAGQANVRDIKGFFSDYGYRVAGDEFSLDLIEHSLLRNNAPRYRGFKPLLSEQDPRLRYRSPVLDPRIHFVLYSACASSPKLRALTDRNLNQELDVAAQDYLLEYVHLDASRKNVYLPKMFEWYRKDFGADGVCRQFVASAMGVHLNEAQIALIKRGALRYLEFDWTLNHT